MVPFDAYVNFVISKTVEHALLRKWPSLLTGELPIIPSFLRDI